MRSALLRERGQPLCIEEVEPTALEPDEVLVKIAGTGTQELFSPQACDAIFGASGGIPRIINLLCDMALVYGYADQKPKIDADTVNEMLEDKAREGGWLFSRPRQRRASHSQGGD